METWEHIVVLTFYIRHSQLNAKYIWNRSSYSISCRFIVATFLYFRWFDPARTPFTDHGRFPNRVLCWLPVLCVGGARGISCHSCNSHRGTGKFTNPIISAQRCTLCLSLFPLPITEFNQVGVEIMRSLFARRLPATTDSLSSSVFFFVFVCVCNLKWQRKSFCQ